MSARVRLSCSTSNLQLSGYKRPGILGSNHTLHSHSAHSPDTAPSYRTQNYDMCLVDNDALNSLGAILNNFELDGGHLMRLEAEQSLDLRYTSPKKMYKLTFPNFCFEFK